MPAAGFYGVGAIEKRGITLHCIEKQGFIGGCGFHLKGVRITEIHLDLTEVHFGSRHFCSKAQRNPFIGSNPHCEKVGFELILLP